MVKYKVRLFVGVLGLLCSTLSMGNPIDMSKVVPFDQVTDHVVAKLFKDPQAVRILFKAMAETINEVGPVAMSGDMLATRADFKNNRLKFWVFMPDMENQLKGIDLTDKKSTQALGTVLMAAFCKKDEFRQLFGALDALEMTFVNSNNKDLFDTAVRWADFPKQ